MGLKICTKLELPKIIDTRGNLTYIENENQIPFQIKRIFYIYDVANGAPRGAHAHRELEQFIIAISGSFDIELKDGKSINNFTLTNPQSGLYIPPMTWVNLGNFSNGAVCLVLTSAPYDEADYIRDYDVFLTAVRENQHDSAIS